MSIELGSAEETQFLREQLKKHNMKLYGPSQWEPFSVVKREDSQVIAGASGFTHWGWLYLEILWVSEKMRGQGLGRQLLQRVDEVAQKRSCRAISVDTAGENNKLFYEKNGYQVFGQLEGYPQGFTKFYLKKEIACVEASGKEKEK